MAVTDVGLENDAPISSAGKVTEKPLLCHVFAQSCSFFAALQCDPSFSSPAFLPPPSPVSYETG